jgi:hypothetical protein
MNHKGVEYSVLQLVDTPDVWKWQFQIGETIKTGKTKTSIEMLARRRGAYQKATDCARLRPPQLLQRAKTIYFTRLPLAQACHAGPRRAASYSPRRVRYR